MLPRDLPRLDAHGAVEVPPDDIVARPEKITRMLRSPHGDQDFSLGCSHACPVSGRDTMFKTDKRRILHELQIATLIRGRAYFSVIVNDPSQSADGGVSA